MYASADSAIYTTQAWLGGVSDAPAADVELLPLGRYVSRLETLPSATRRSFPGLSFNEGEPAALAPQVRAAAEILTCVDGLGDSLGCLVRSIHALRAPRNHDVSHSTPALPFSVFVSVPGADEKDATLRLAESLVHEAMHLQLTLIERTGALVIDRRRQAYTACMCSRSSTKFSICSPKRSHDRVATAPNVESRLGRRWLLFRESQTAYRCSEEPCGDDASPLSPRRRWSARRARSEGRFGRGFNSPKCPRLPSATRRRL
jgi:hypothetical protein